MFYLLVVLSMLVCVVIYLLAEIVSLLFGFEPYQENDDE